MNYTYKWLNAEQTQLHGQDGNHVICFAAFKGNPPYDEFIESGKVAAAYVEPPPPTPLTTEEKVTKLLSDYGLSREELKTVINE